MRKITLWIRDDLYEWLNAHTQINSSLLFERAIDEAKRKFGKPYQTTDKAFEIFKEHQLLVRKMHSVVASPSEDAISDDETDEVAWIAHVQDDGRVADTVISLVGITTFSNSKEVAKCFKCGKKETDSNRLGYADLLGAYICEECMGEKLKEES